MRALSAIEAAALAIVARSGDITCANLGNELWHRGGLSNCSCPFARPAGVVIKSLRTLGLVERFRREGDPRTLYQATQLGKAKVRLP